MLGCHHDAYGHRISLTTTPTGGATKRYAYGYDVHGSVSTLMNIDNPGPPTATYGYRPYGEHLAVIASNNGAEKSPSWFFNLLANPVATVEVGPNKFQVRARVSGPEERPRLGAIIDYLEQQQALTSRQIPVVVLERL